MKFKVGDRVSYKGRRGKIEEIYNMFVPVMPPAQTKFIIVILDDDGIILCRESELKKLVKKPKQFKVGDRVIFYFANDPYLSPEKGTIKKTILFSKGSEYFFVEFDDKEFRGGFFKSNHFKKLIKKKKEFKPGDRVVCKYTGLKGTIMKTDESYPSREHTISIKMDKELAIAFRRPEYLKKLVKKKKEFKPGDRVICKYTGAKGTIMTVGVDHPWGMGHLIAIDIDKESATAFRRPEDLKKLVKRKNNVALFS